ncbi:MAG: translocation/assembly module TamB domain-containing protein [Pseudomonadota bacterium]
MTARRAQAQKPWWRRMISWQAALRILLLVLTGVLGFGFWLVGTETGSRTSIAWASGLLPNFRVEYGSGTVLGPLQLEKVVLKGRTRIEADNVFLDWSPGNLLLGELTLTDIRIARVKVVQPAPAATTGIRTARHPADMALPLDLHIERLVIDELLHLRGEKQNSYTRLSAGLSWQEHDLQVRQLVIGTARWETAFGGSLQTRGDWPLDARLRFVFPRPAAPDDAGSHNNTAHNNTAHDSTAADATPETAPWILAGTLRGPLARVQAALDVDGPAQAHIAGELEPLVTGIPFRATLAADTLRLPPRATADRAATLSSLQLAGRGDLLGALTLDGHAVLDTPWTQPVAANLAAAGSWRGMERMEVRFDDPRFRAALVTDYRWLDGQQFRGRLEVQNLDLVLTHPALHSQLAGSMTIDGAIPPAGKPGGPAVALAIDTLAGTLNGRHDVAIDGRLRWQEAQWLFEPLNLRQGENRAGLTGSLATQWNAAATLDLKRVDTLLPGFAGRGTGHATIRGSPTEPRLALQLDAQSLQLPAVTLPAPVSRTLRVPAADWRIEGDAGLHDIVLTDAHTVGAPFSLQATGTVDWARGIVWNLDTALGDFALAQLLPELGGTVGGPFHTSGVMRETLEALSISTTLNGELSGMPLDFSTGLDWQPRQFDLQRLDLVHGGNALHAQAALDGNDARLVLDIDAPVLADSLRDVGGRLRLQADVSGPRQALDARIAIDAGSLRWRDLALTGITGTLQLDDGAQSSSMLQLDATGLRRGDAFVDTAHLSAAGTLADHRLEAGAASGPLSFLLAAAGEWLRNPESSDASGDRDPTPQVLWRGKLDNGGFDMHQWHWSTAGEAAMEILRSASGPQLALAPHCWSDNAARVCLTAPARLGNSGEFALEAFHLPLEALLADILPLDTTVRGRLGGTLSARWQDGVLQQADAGLRNAEPLQISLVDDEDIARDIAGIGQVLATARLRDNAWHAEARIDGAQDGSLNARFDAAAPGADGSRRLDGALHAAGLQLDLLEAFTYQMHHIGGAADLDIALSGTDRHPQMAGKVHLGDGKLTFSRVPLSLVDINLDGRFAGNELHLDGHFRTPDSEHEARVDGLFTLTGKNLTGHAGLSGEKLVLSFPPQYQFSVSPDLRLDVGTDEVALTGNVRVPYGRIEVKKLPVQSVSRSRDVVVIRSEQVIDEGGVGFRQRVDINLLLGNDVQFKAFGGEGSLTGELRLRSTPALPLLVDGELHVQDGQYRALGQQLKLKQADIIFNGPADQPLIDALAVRTFSDAAVREVGVRLTGSLRAPQTTLWSSPDLPQEEALSWLTTGRPLSEGPIDLRGEAAQAALSLGAAQGSALLTQAGQEIGLHDVQLATSGDGDEAEVQVGTNLNERVFVGYNRRVFTGEASVLLRLQMTRRLVLEALSGVESALDIFYTFEF